MTKIYTALDRLAQGAAKCAFALGALCMILMMLHIGGDVIARTFFGGSLLGTLEVTAQWYMIGIVYLPLALLMLQDHHISVDLLTHALSRRMQQALRAFTCFLALGYFWFWAQAALDLAQRATKRGAYIDAGMNQIITWPVYWACFASVCLLGLATFVAMLKALGEMRAAGPAVPHHPTDLPEA